MQPISYARHQFPREVIRHAVWLYLRFTLSYRDVEELMDARGVLLTYEAVRYWSFGQKTYPAFRCEVPCSRPHTI